MSSDSADGRLDKAESSDIICDIVVTEIPTNPYKPGPHHSVRMEGRKAALQPDFDLKEIGVDYLSAQAEGLQRAFDLGKRAGLRFADRDALTAFRPRS